MEWQTVHEAKPFLLSMVQAKAVLFAQERWRALQTQIFLKVSTERFMDFEGHAESSLGVKWSKLMNDLDHGRVPLECERKRACGK